MKQILVLTIFQWIVINFFTMAGKNFDTVANKVTQLFSQTKTFTQPLWLHSGILVISLAIKGLLLSQMHALYT